MRINRNTLLAVAGLARDAGKAISKLSSKFVRLPENLKNAFSKSGDRLAKMEARNVKHESKAAQKADREFKKWFRNAPDEEKQKYYADQLKP